MKDREGPRSRIRHVTVQGGRRKSKLTRSVGFDKGKKKTTKTAMTEMEVGIEAHVKRSGVRIVTLSAERRLGQTAPSSMDGHVMIDVLAARPEFI